MRFIADFHIHSKYSRATSKEMNVVSLYKWGQIKGINVLATGDFTHPRYFDEFKLKKSIAKKVDLEVPKSCKNKLRYIFSAEISCIYKKNDRVRKMHCLVLAPNFKAVAKINAALHEIGNIKSDGRPILGLDAKELLKIVLEADENCIFIPAHVWTPWFSVFGSKSGFDTLEEAFDELTPYIYALETGLSSDPLMNWRIAKNDGLALVSNSDAHSPRKIGREANVFNTELSYDAILKALKNNSLKEFEYTIEFFPEEGKYHLDGHRTCNMRMEPEETIKHNFLCPKCNKKVTVGVLHRVNELATRKMGYKPKGARPFKSIIPLAKVISEVEQVGPTSKKVETIYHSLINHLGNEFKILLDTPITDIKEQAPMVAEAIKRMRSNKVHLAGGYDGEFGTIKIFSEKEKQNK